MSGLAEVISYLEASEQELLQQVRAVEEIHIGRNGGWTPAQVVTHLVRTEQLMFLIWTLVPRLRRWPVLLRWLDRTNSGLWRLMGMRTVADGNFGAETPEAGRYQAPVFLRPVHQPARSLESLLAWRRKVRERSLRAICRLDDQALMLRWSHPLLGERTLLEFVQFLGIHERHHLPQIRPSNQATPHSN